ncbi:MAG: hypothetical protein ACK52J_02900 [bacterium]|jgi:hypothetical protein
MTLSPCGKKVAIGDSAHKIKFFDIEKKESLVDTWTSHSSSII